jgi:hypothetical protein
MYEYGTLKPVEIISRRGVEKEINGENEPNPGTKYVYVEMSQ